MEPDPIKTKRQYRNMPNVEILKKLTWLVVNIIWSPLLLPGRHSSDQSSRDQGQNKFGGFIRVKITHIDDVTNRTKSDDPDLIHATMSLLR